MDVGGQRLDRYFVRWYIDSFGAVERSEKGFAKLKTTKKDLKAAMDLDIKLATSTSDLMVRECTKELLLIQIERMRDRNKARPKNKQLRIPDDKLDKNTKKGIIVDFLTTGRIKEFRAFPKLKGTLVNQIMKERGDSNVILEADRKKLIGSETQLGDNFLLGVGLSDAAYEGHVRVLRLRSRLLGGEILASSFKSGGGSLATVPSDLDCPPSLCVRRCSVLLKLMTACVFIRSAPNLAAASLVRALCSENLITPMKDSSSFLTAVLSFI
eukprot:scaffold24026_cov129-Skeletonema_marinoi.AAC.1